MKVKCAFSTVWAIRHIISRASIISNLKNNNALRLSSNYNFLRKKLQSTKTFIFCLPVKYCIIFIYNLYIGDYSWKMLMSFHEFCYTKKIIPLVIWTFFLYKHSIVKLRNAIVVFLGNPLNFTISSVEMWKYIPPVYTVSSHPWNHKN